MKQLSVVLTLIGALFATGGCVTATPPPAIAQLAADDVAYRNHVGFVRGYIGRHGPYWFLLDTGASLSAIDSRVAAEIGLEAGETTTVEGAAGTIDTTYASIPLLTIGGLSFQDLAPTMYDLSGSLAPEGEQIAGILGHDVIGALAIDFDIAGGGLRLSRHAEAFALGVPSAVIPFELDNNIPRFEAAINGIEAFFRLDSGASFPPTDTFYANITSRFAERLRQRQPELEPDRYFTASGTGGEIRIAVLPGESVRLGGQTIDDPFLIVQPETGYFARADAVGFFGNYALARFGRFVVDYPGRRILIY